MPHIRSVPYRPWGRLDWLLPRLGAAKWSLLGAMSPEARCLSTWRTLTGSGTLGAYQLLRIDPAPPRTPELKPIAESWASRRQDLLRDQVGLFEKAGGDSRVVLGARLDDEAYKIHAIYQGFRAASGDAVVLDISSLPKRYFFPLLRFLVADKTLRDILVTYAIPETYANRLGADNQEWDNLPTFPNADPRWSPAELMVGIGHEPLGLPALWAGLSKQALMLRLLMPFPPGPPHLAKNWRFVHSVVEGTDAARFRVAGVDARDASSAFTLISASGNGKDVMLAPYGPKPISLAMALYAIGSGSPVFYNQPNLYNPDYCSGIAKVDGHDLTFGYCVRLDGCDLYTL